MTDVVVVALVTGLVSIVGSIVTATVTYRSAQFQLQSAKQSADATRESAIAQANATRWSSAMQAAAATKTAELSSRGVLGSAEVAHRATIRVEAQKRFASWQQYKRELYIAALKEVTAHRDALLANRPRSDAAAREALLTAQLVANEHLRVGISLYLGLMDNANAMQSPDVLERLIEDMNADARDEGSGD